MKTRAGSVSAVSMLQIVAECLGYHVAPAPFLGAVVASRALAGTRHERLLADIASGQCRVGIAFTEAVGARADGRVAFESGKLSGRALFVADAGAHQYLVATPEGQLCLVPASEAQVTPITTIDKTRAPARSR
ncbi:MAG: hypothetical protein U5O39_09745 [Gammaproteobacteria bacterium]|nr:hypothetical protein [Gammaproteobacteria bacterium]